MTQADHGKPLPFEERCVTALQEIRDAAPLVAEPARFGPISAVLSDPDSIFLSLAEDENLPFDTDIREHFFRFNEVECSWHSSDSNSELVGEFYVTHLYRCMGKRMERTWEGSDDWERELFKDLRIFDETPHTGTGRMATLRVTPDATDPEVWYFDMRRGALRMDIGYAAYLDNILITKGTIGWQYLFCDVSLDETSVAALKKGLTEMIETFPTLFPGHDYSELVSRYEERL